MKEVWNCGCTEGAIVVTTIGEGAVLDKYYDNFSRFGHLDEVTIYVVVDNKTPSELMEKVVRLRKSGLHVTAPDMREQVEYSLKLGVPKGMFLENSDHRRNLGYLAAYESAASVIISIDDDNYPLQNEDFYASHRKSLNPPSEVDEVTATNKFFNICEMMEFEPFGTTAFARGFPYFARHVTNAIEHRQVSNVKVGINAGLWLQDPDVDAISWLVNPRNSTHLLNSQVILAPNTWTPINSQNTSLAHEVIPSYYFIRMGATLNGVRIDRYGDIFQGYFAEACSKALGIAVSAGTPAVLHRRNTHNYLQDACQELNCIILLEDFLQWLTGEVILEGNNYCDAYLSLAEAIEGFACGYVKRYRSKDVQQYYVGTASQMRDWIRICSTINGS